MTRLILLAALFLVQWNTLFGAVYLHEGFNSLALPAGWNVRRVSGAIATWSFVGQGSNPTVSPYAGAGQAKFNSWDAAAGEQARLISAAFNLTSSTDPFLSLSMYHDDEYLAALDSLYVEVSTADSIVGPWATLAGFRRAKPENGWIREIISLYQYRGTSRVFLSLRGVSRYGNNIFIDEVRVADSTFHDIGTVALHYAAPGGAAHPQIEPMPSLSRHPKMKQELRTHEPSEIVHAAANAPMSIRVVTRNFGTFAEPTYGISWLVDAQSQPNVSGGPIAARTGQDTLSLTWATPVAGIHTITAWTVLATDSTRTNDTTRLVIHVLDTATVFYESFNGGTFPPANWIVINRDGGGSPPWFRGTDTSSFGPFEGSGFAANNFLRANNGYLDDYLISPPIAGVGQPGRVDSLIFWARSMNNPAPATNYPDSLMVLLSTTGADTSNFTIRLDYFAIPKSGWTRKAYQISSRVPTNSAVHVAFRYLLYNVLPSGGSGDFIGIDAVQCVRPLPTNVAQVASMPQTFTLKQNYPNPFNPSTKIRFAVSGSGVVTLTVYDVFGREVQTLVREDLPPGSYETTFDASRLASGIYLYKLQAGRFTQTRKLVVLR